MMKSLLDRSFKSCRIAGAVYVAFIVLFASSRAHAGMITSTGLLSVATDNVLRSYTFNGTLQETLSIHLPTGAFANTGVAQGVSVLNGRIFVGLVSTNGSFTPKIVEIDSTTGDALNVLNTATPQITALGDDGTNLLLLDSVNTFQVYTYSTSGSLVSKVDLERPFSGHIQAEGIDGDGQNIFISYDSNLQPILTNLATGPFVSSFDTNINPNALIGGLAYDSSDGTLWIAHSTGFRNYSQSGDLLSQTTTPMGITFTGLEVIPLDSATVPEPSSVALAALGMLGCFAYFLCNRRTPNLANRQN